MVALGSTNQAPARFHRVLTGGGLLPDATNVAAFAWAAAVPHVSLAAAARLVPEAGESGLKYCNLPSSRIFWVRQLMLPRDPSEVAAALRVYGAVLPGVAAALLYEQRGVALGWVGEVVEAHCCTPLRLLRPALPWESNNSPISCSVAANPTLQVVGEFVLFQGSVGRTKRGAAHI